MLGCSNGHRFDTNRRGYLTTSIARGITGDSRPILEARAAFLSLGHYSPIAQAVAAAVGAAERVVDSGTGTGYYLGQIPAGDRLAVDVSAAAVAMATAAIGCPGLVTDVWQPSPIRDARADAVLCVFAPRNADEFWRILRPGGRLVVVTPAPQHLAQLRAAGLAIGMHDDKLPSLDASMAAFALTSRERLAYELELDEHASRLLTGMGPSGHHDLAGSYAGTVSVAVDVSVFTKPV